MQLNIPLAFRLVAPVSLFGLLVYLVLPYATNKSDLSFKKKDTYSVVSNSSWKTIILWNKMYRDKTFGLGELSRDTLQNLKCPIFNCEVTRDQNRVNDAHAVMFHMVKSSHNLPKTRSPNQIYVQFVRESPSNHGYNLNDVINMTMTYRRDSDLYYPVYTVTQRNAPGRPLLNSSFSGKTKSVVWMVSHCHTKMKRERYVKELAKYIDVDIIGICGKIKCPKKKMNHCMDMIKATYKFIIGFENSYCVDYVTEKLFRPLEYDIIPIVFGGANYSLLAPPRSYINAQDFSSPRHLADFLKQLGSNETAYLEYMKWKLTHDVARTEIAPSFCKLCEILHQPVFPKSYPSFSKWWANGKCDDKSVLRKLPPN